MQLRPIADIPHSVTYQLCLGSGVSAHLGHHGWLDLDEWLLRPGLSGSATRGRGHACRNLSSGTLVSLRYPGRVASQCRGATALVAEAVSDRANVNPASDQLSSVVRAELLNRRLKPQVARQSAKPLRHRIGLQVVTSIRLAREHERVRTQLDANRGLVGNRGQLSAHDRSDPP
jgi:hypothetical protein